LNYNILSSPVQFVSNYEYSKKLDGLDPIKELRSHFQTSSFDEKSAIYFCGHSLGLMPLKSKIYTIEILDKWSSKAVRGHFSLPNPWIQALYPLSNEMAKIVGAKSQECTIMNTLSVNLHLMMASFYQPKPGRYKVLMENKPFPSDLYAVQSQLRFHGYPPDSIIFPESKEHNITTNEDLLSAIEKNKNELALILLGGINYYTGQLFDLESVCNLSKSLGIPIGLDLAHAAGNASLNLNKWSPDFAVWCSYKYMNGGPGSLGACFIPERNHNHIQRLEGWWGNKLETRFEMRHTQDRAIGAEAWQLSTHPILATGGIKASMEVFSQVDFKTLVQKSNMMSMYLFYLLNNLKTNQFDVITPQNDHSFGSQTSLFFPVNGAEIYAKLSSREIICDWRSPNIIRIAPTPLYNTYQEIYRFVEILKECIDDQR
jgi:kynureninase